jgi:hypothetical protein
MDAEVTILVLIVLQEFRDLAQFGTTEKRVTPFTRSVLSRDAKVLAWLTPPELHDEH